jgi:hypothetical protein
MISVSLLVSSIAVIATAAFAEPAAPRLTPFEPDATVNVRDVGAQGRGDADDTKALQKSLEGGNRVVVIPPGNYKISRSLKVASRTHIKADPKAIIRMADKAGYDVDTYLLTNADSEKGNQDITIEGGVWDGNNAHNPRGPRNGVRPSYGGVAISFIKVHNLVIRQLTVRNPESYSIRLGEISDFMVENIVFDQSSPRPNQDGIHLGGFCCRGVIRHLSVSSPAGTNDDMVAINADDDVTSIFNVGMKLGTIRDIRVEDVKSPDAYTFVRMLSTKNVIENILVDGIAGGCRMNVINMDSWRFPAGKGILRNITIRNCHVHKTTEDKPFPCVFIQSTVKNMRIENFVRDKAGAPKAPTLLLENGQRNYLAIGGLDEQQSRDLRQSLPQLSANSLTDASASSGHRDKYLRIETRNRVILGHGDIVELKLSASNP